MKNTGFTTTILHSDRLDSPEHGSLHKPIHTSVAYGYEDVEDLTDIFQGKAKGYAYARQGNPTTKALEVKLSKMENSLASVVFSTGMAAITSILLSLLRKGDHVITSAFLFGNTNSVFNTLNSQGIDFTFVDATENKNIQEAYQENTKVVFTETIANPVTQVADLKKIGEFCQEKNLIYIVDNTMTSPYLFQPKEVRASLIVNALTKYIGGHGNALGGAITDTGLYDWQNFPNIYDSYQNQPPEMWGITQIRKKGLRDFGAALSPESAHLLAVGAETVALRMERSCGNAMKLAEMFQRHPNIVQVNYPGLEDHPQHRLAKELFRHYGSLMSIELNHDIDCLTFQNKLDIVISSSNLGDNRTLAIPVAKTIFYEIGPERRSIMGIPESLIRLSIGIEDCDDLLNDFQQALDSF